MREYTGKVRIEKTAPSDRKDTATKSDKRFAGNPHGVANVNQPQGPRVGNEGAHSAKRGNFKAEKAERQPLADQIEAAFARRQMDDYADHDWPRQGSIDDNSGIRRFANRKR